MSIDLSVFLKFQSIEDVMSYFNKHYEQWLNNGLLKVSYKRGIGVEYNFIEPISAHDLNQGVQLGFAAFVKNKKYIEHPASFSFNESGQLFQVLWARKGMLWRSQGPAQLLIENQRVVRQVYHQGLMYKDEEVYKKENNLSAEQLEQKAKKRLTDWQQKYQQPCGKMLQDQIKKSVLYLSHYDDLKRINQMFKSDKWIPMSVPMRFEQKVPSTKPVINSFAKKGKICGAIDGIEHGSIVENMYVYLGAWQRFDGVMDLSAEDSDPLQSLISSGKPAFEAYDEEQNLVQESFYQWGLLHHPTEAAIRKYQNNQLVEYTYYQHGKKHREAYDQVGNLLPAHECIGEKKAYYLENQQLNPEAVLAIEQQYKLLKHINENLRNSGNKNTTSL